MNPTVLIAGATGFVGGHLIGCLSARRARGVTCLARREVIVGPHIRTLATDFRGPSAGLDAAIDAVFLCLGSTPSRAGGKAEFRRMEDDLAVTVAGWAAERGARQCAYISSLGADPKSASFYLRTKAETESSLAGIGFETLHLFRPSFLTGRPRPLWSERASALLCQSIDVVGFGPKSGALKPIPGAIVAKAMLGAVDGGGQGRLVHHHAHMLRLAGGQTNGLAP